MAFNYFMPRQNNGLMVNVVGKITQFAFANDLAAWPVYAAQGHYKAKITLTKVYAGAERPLTQAWGLYGFTMCYRETKDKSYLAQAQQIDLIFNAI
jgi:hypothetical protein